MGACAILWAIWLTRNDITFNCARVSSSLQVLFRGTYWIRFWALLQKEEERPLVLEGCRTLSVLPWKSSLRMDGLSLIGLPMSKFFSLFYFCYSVLSRSDACCCVVCGFEQLYVSIDTEAGICLIYVPNSKKVQSASDKTKHWSLTR